MLIYNFSFRLSIEDLNIDNINFLKILESSLINSLLVLMNFSQSSTDRIKPKHLTFIKIYINLSIIFNLIF